MKPYVLAIATGDWHLWDTPPLFRENEPDWWVAMQRPIDQIKALQNKHSGCPIIFDGDLFDHWKATPELINWAIKHVPHMYAIPGQHDLPYHRYDQIHKSAYWTLVEAGKLTDLKPNGFHPVGRLMLHAFPWGHEVKPTNSHGLDGFNVAVVHAYCWHKGYSYPGAPAEKAAMAWGKKLGGYQFACFGDQHKGFDLEFGDGTALVNTGTLMRRKSDEGEYSPRVYLLWSDGAVQAKKLDTSEDVCLEAEQVKKKVVEALDATEMLEILSKLKTAFIDFPSALKEVMERMGVNKEVRRRVLESCEG